MKAPVITAFVVASVLAFGPATAATDDIRLVEAVQRRDVVAAQALVRKKVDVNTTQPDGATALHWAAHWNDLATADLLIRAGADVTRTNVYGVTPLELACTNGSAAMVALLLQTGASTETTFSTGETALMRAARVGDLATVKTLLASGANVHARERDEDQTALMWAAADKHAGVVRVLLEAGADVHARSKALDKPRAGGFDYDPLLAPYGGYTPLLFAAQAGALDVTRVLLAAGARINDAAADGTTPLLAAVIRGYIAVATTLLEHGADPNAASAGYTALHWAAGAWESTLTGGVIAVEDIPRNDTWTAFGGLHGSAKRDFVKTLLAHGADPNARMAAMPPRFGYTVCPRILRQTVLKGATPFVLAAMAADVDVMRILLASGADPDAATDAPLRTTPLIAAAGLFFCPGESRATDDDALAATSFLLRNTGADINAANGEGHTALLVAAWSGFDRVVQFLADRGADVNARDRRGSSAVMLAALAGSGKVPYPSTIALLHKLGAN